VTATFVGLFFIGLIAAVRVMLYGVERQRSATDTGSRSFSVSPVVVASFSIVAGMLGYILVKLRVAPLTTWSTVLAAGVLTSAASARVIARWWTVVPEHDVDDERYVLQGSLAKVVSDITELGTGQVTLQADAAKRPMPARAIDDQPVRAGTEVVIERIENGVAFVEEWAAVEKRL
jgi:hypothetical protein